MIYIFLYNVIHVKCDISKIPSAKKMILIASQYCLNKLSEKNRKCFNEIYEISRNFQSIDLNAVENIVKNYVKIYGASNIVLISNEDSTHLTCSYLREKYKIRGPLLNELLPFVNKVISKEKLENIVRIPKFSKFDKIEYLKDKDRYLNNLINMLNFPMFIKPIDLVSSIETHYIPNKDVLYNISDKLINIPYEFEIDEFIDGELFHCDAIIINGNLEFFMVGKCSYALARFFEGKPVGSIPIKDQKLFNDLKLFCQKVFKKLNCNAGVYHLEAFLEKGSKELVFLEIAARSGGALLTRVYEKAFGINIEEINILIQLGLINKLKIIDSKVFVGFLNFPNIEGQIVEIIKPHINIDHEFIEFSKIKDNLSTPKNLLDIACSVIFWSPSYSKVVNTFEYLRNFQPLVLKK